MSNIALKTMIDATAQELKVLTTDAETLQDALIPKGELSQETMASLQRLDYLTQSLEALSGIWSKLTDDIPEDWAVQNQASIDNIGLKDLAAKLKGVVPPSLSASLAHSGDLEEF